MDKTLVSDLKLLLWNTRDKLPERIFLLRMFLVLVGIVTSVLYLIPLKEIPKLLSRAKKRLDSAKDNWHTDEWHINALRFMIPVILISLL